MNYLYDMATKRTHIISGYFSRKRGHVSLSFLKLEYDTHSSVCHTLKELTDPIIILMVSRVLTGKCKTEHLFHIKHLLGHVASNSSPDLIIC